MKIKLVGTNDLGKKVSLNTTTGEDGTYAFSDVRPGKYTIIETQPAKYKDGKDTPARQLASRRPTTRFRTSPSVPVSMPPATSSANRRLRI